MENFEPTINFKTKDEMFRYLCEHFFFNGNYQKAAEATMLREEQNRFNFVIGYSHYINKDYASAYRFYHECIDAEEPNIDEPGCYIGLGILYRNGLGVEKDTRKANRYIKKGLNFVQECKLFADKRYRKWLEFWEDLAKEK